MPHILCDKCEVETWIEPLEGKNIDLSIFEQLRTQGWKRRHKKEFGYLSVIRKVNECRFLCPNCSIWS